MTLMETITAPAHISVNNPSVFSINITPADPTWVGAWWIPYIISSIGAAGMAVYLGMFPQQIPGIL